MRHALPIIPEMKCDVACGECCGIVPATEEEFEEISMFAKERGIAPVDNGITCPWYQRGRCSVYEVRPIICRFFGHSERMKCSRGYNTNLPEEVVRTAVLAETKGKKMKHLHDVLKVDVCKKR